MPDNAGTDETGGARVLDSLREALAAWPDLGSRTRVSIEQWNNSTASEAKAYQDISVSAVRGAVGWREVADQIRALGRQRYEPAVPTLTGLWEQCPVQPVQVAAAHALFGIGTGEARDVLRQGIHDHEHLARFMALKVMFTDEGTAWDNVSHLFADDSLATLSGQTAAVEALSLLSPRSYSRSGPEWHSDELRGLVSADRRWLDLCVGLRDHESLGRQARQVLRYADSAVTRPALDAARAVRAAQPRPVGAPYSVWLPYAGADPIVRYEEHHLTFTDYLRHAFAGKGFLRLDRREEWLARGVTRDRLAELDGWLGSVEYEHTDF